MTMISQIDELKKLLAPKVPELGLDEGTVENILSTASDFSEKELKPSALKWEEIGTHFWQIYDAKLRSGNGRVELTENEYRILEKYRCIDNAEAKGKRLVFPEYFEEAHRKLAGTGLTGLCIPEEYGGMGFPFSLYCPVIEILSGGDASFGVHLSIHGTASDLINRYGTVVLKERLLPAMASGKKLGCLVFTEPSGGSDLKAVSTTSEFTGNSCRINGTKFSITNGGYSDVHVVFTVDKEDYNLPFAQRKKYNTFVVEKGTEGFELLGIGNTMGWRPSPTSMLKFENCDVPVDNLLGEKGSGRMVLSTGLSAGRVSFGCAWSLGIADAAYRKAMERADKRVTFGEKIKNHPEIRKHLADMYRYLCIGREKYLHAAYLKDKNDPDFPFEATISKIFCSERAEDIVRTAYQMHGHFGYMEGSGMPVLFRNVMVATVGEGATEVLRDRVIAPYVGKGKYSRTGAIEYDRSFIDMNLGEETFRELSQALGDEVYPCYEILLSKATGKKIRVPATEIKHLTINWKLNGL
ncbi:Crotonobetainyl-CoA dehydrogenase [uncultured archaeon]|nr:Crotonobetainyl-CoA dehydrogenase [uncultured archaeon]